MEDLKWFRKSEQKQIIQGIEEQVAYEPAIETRNHKPLRPNQMSTWELRIGRFRVFYDVRLPDQIVKVKAIGYKEGNRLFIRGEEYEL